MGTVWNIGAVDKVVLAVAPMETDTGNTKKVEITVDSGAGTSCWPEKLLKSIPMMPKAKGVKFKAANRSELKYLGTKKIQFYPTDSHKREGGKADDVCELNFHVTDTTKPLAAAMAIAKMGNRIVLEDGPGKSYIECLKTGSRLMLKESGGTYVFDAECITGAKSPIFSRRG